MLLAVAGLLLPGPAAADHDSFCYAIGDRDHLLVRIEKFDFNTDTNETNIGNTGTAKTDGMAIDPSTGVLYGVNILMVEQRGYAGTISLSDGGFNPFGPELGTGSGALGNVTFYDISGMTFDPATGALYATHVRVGQGVPDALFRIDPATGQHVSDAFGPGVDYVPLYPLPAYTNLSDVDDIAIDPTNGQMYGVVNNSTNGDRLVRIDKVTGALSDVGAFGIGEVEGLDFDPHGRLWATAGGASGTEANKLYEVNKSTGVASNPRNLNNSYNYEALACMVAGGVSGAPDLFVSKSDGGATTSPDSVIRYNITYANTGNQAAGEAVITETVPEHTAFVSGSSTSGWQRVGTSSTYVFNLGTLDPGETGVVVFAVRVDDDVPGSVNQITNTAQISHSTGNPDSEPGDNTSTDTTPIGGTPTPGPTPTDVPDPGPLDERIYLPIIGR